MNGDITPGELGQIRANENGRAIGDLHRRIEKLEERIAALESAQPASAASQPREASPLLASLATTVLPALLKAAQGGRGGTIPATRAT